MSGTLGKRLFSRRPGLAYALVLAIAAPIALTFAAASAFWRTAGRFSGYRPSEPSRLYGRALVLARDQRADPVAFDSRLRREGYEARATPVALRPGSFARPDSQTFLIAARETPGVALVPSPTEVVLSGDRIAALRVAGEPRDRIALDPPLLASYYGPDLRECRAVEIDRLPSHVIEAVLAAEDAGYFEHQGVAPAAIVRAALVNLGAGRVRQGGSTITQQLARSLYLSQRRTWTRKYREALLSLVLEMRYSKRQLLEAYLNEVYLGRSGSINLVGIGAAARAYFGKPAESLEVAEAALLAGMIRSPGEYAPTLHPQRAVERRNHVLRRMAALGWLDPQLVEQEVRRPLGLRPESLPVYAEVGFFADAMAEEARDRFRIADLAGGGYDLFTTLDREDQRQAAEAVADGLKDLPAGHGGDGALQAALVSLDPTDGSIRAWIGGRDYGESQFDRVRRARRQAGSTFKPVVYAAALMAGANLADPVLDAPVMVRMQGAEWRPHNDDGRFRGSVSMRNAMEQSLNIPTLRLALGAGLPRVGELAAAFGLTVPAADNPALALGAIDVTPLELAGLYATLAASGVRASPFGLQRVVDRDGRERPGLHPPASQRVLDEDTAFLVTSLLQGVVDRGTAAGVRRMGLRGPLAGKTGTSDEGRDAWFAGYTRDRASVVWVGRDDNSPAGLSGSRVALPIWARFTAATGPEGGAKPWTVPAGVESAEIDPDTGALATAFCPHRRTDFFYTSRVPVFACPMHAMPGAEWAVLAAAPPAGDPSQTVIVLNAAGEGGSSWMVFQRKPPPAGGALPSASALPPGR
jgi:penicillin-binding protein 1B